MFSSIFVQTLLVHVLFVQLTCLYNIINKETWSSGSAHVFFIHLVIFKEWKKTSSKVHFRSIILYKYVYLTILRDKNNW